MDITTEPKYRVGDTLQCLDIRQVLFRRDLVVVRSDQHTVCLVTEGFDSIFFVDPNDQAIELKESGIGKLTDAQEALLRHVLETWDVAQMFAKFPHLVKQTLDSTQLGQGQPTRIALTATVAKPLADNWRRSVAILELLRAVDPRVPQDVDRLLMEWMLFLVAQAPQTVAVNKIMGGAS